MKYTIKTQTQDDIQCESYTLLTNKGIMYSMDKEITQESKNVGYVSECELKCVLLNVHEPQTTTIQFEPTIGEA